MAKSTSREEVTITKDDVGTVKLDGGKNIQAAAMTSAGRGLMGGGPKNVAAAFIQACMVAAVKACHEGGVKDPLVIRDAQMRAKKMGEQQLAAAIAEATAKLQADAGLKPTTKPA